MKSNPFQIAIEIKTEKGAVLKPTRLHFWNLGDKNSPKHLQGLTPHNPFKFYTDAILALCFHKITDYKNTTAEQKNFYEKAYRFFDPYTELFYKSKPRTKSLGSKDLKQHIHFENFEKKMTEAWEKAFKGNTLQLQELDECLDCITELEHSMQAPLIYNFSVHFSESFTEKLLCFYSMLFHLRSVIAVDHNAHVEDSSYEAVKCDSISDYLPKSDYTANDALLYWNFKKICQSFSSHKDKDAKAEKHFVEPMLTHFKHYSHNAYCLIEQLPHSFLSELNQSELEEALHHVQMDWLLGSEAGMLFKVREELYAVAEGYDKIFWTEATHSKAKSASTLNLCFEISEKDLGQKISAA